MSLVQLTRPDGPPVAINPDGNVYLPPKCYLFQLTANGWLRCPDHTEPVSLSPYLSDPLAGYVASLDKGTMVYAFKHQQGQRLLGSWIDAAAVAVGR